MNDVGVEAVLRKGADLIEQEGMWCNGMWFQAEFGTDGLESDYTDDQLLEGDVTVDKVLDRHRCAEGALALAAVMLDEENARRLYESAKEAARGVIGLSFTENKLYEWNDTLPEGDQGFAVAEVFRRAADGLTG